MHIDKNVALPAEQRGAPSKYPFENMTVGDSFYTTEIRSRLNSVTQYRKKRYGERYTIRAVGSGFRVWRMA